MGRIHTDSQGRPQAATAVTTVHTNSAGAADGPRGLQDRRALSGLEDPQTPGSNSALPMWPPRTRAGGWAARPAPGLRCTHYRLAARRVRPGRSGLVRTSSRFFQGRVGDSDLNAERNSEQLSAICCAIGCGARGFGASRKRGPCRREALVRPLGGSKAVRSVRDTQVASGLSGAGARILGRSDAPSLALSTRAGAATRCASPSSTSGRAS